MERIRLPPTYLRAKSGAGLQESVVVPSSYPHPHDTKSPARQGAFLLRQEVSPTFVAIGGAGG